MTENVDIRGGAGEFEAAVIAVVLDRISRDEIAAAQRRAQQSPTLPPWVRAVRPDEPQHPMDSSKVGW